MSTVVEIQFVVVVVSVLLGQFLLCLSKVRRKYISWHFSKIFVSHSLSASYVLSHFEMWNTRILLCELCISSIRQWTVLWFPFPVIGKMDSPSPLDVFPSNQSNAILLSDVSHQSPFYFSICKFEAWLKKSFPYKIMVNWTFPQLT
jgi:hypothetical protein